MRLAQILLIFLSIQATEIHGLTLHRAVMAADAHSIDMDGWSLVAQAWKRIVGIRPTLALIADESVVVDETIGDIIRFKPLSDVPTWFYAQIIKLFLPAYFEQEGCIISDIDMMPLTKRYFIENSAAHKDNAFIIYRDRTYEHEARSKYPMCYCAARGETFKNIIGLKHVDDIPVIVRHWWFNYAQKENLGRNTGVVVFSRLVNAWHTRMMGCVKLGHNIHRRIDCDNGEYHEQLVRDGYYIDFHMALPYKEHKSAIDSMASIVGLDPELTLKLNN